MNAATPWPWPLPDADSGLGSLFGNAPVGIAQCAPQGTVTGVNPALAKIIGAPLPDPLFFGDLIHAEDRGESEQLFREMVAGQRASFQVENRCVTADGSAAPMRWTAWRVPGCNGSPDYGLVMAEDLTKNRSSEQRLREAERLEAVGRLAGGVAHDFNNLLTGVILYCDLMLGALESGSRVRRYAEEIHAAGMQATGLVRQLLSLSRPENSEPKPVSLNRIAEGMRELLVRLIGENIELQLQLDPNLGLVKMDTIQVQQILLNLVLNSRDAMPEGGRITVETSNCRLQMLAATAPGVRPALLPCALFAVTDTGSGMDDETRKHLFEAFFTTKAAGKGTGLGLATVYDIVTSGGGLIRAESQPGCGTRFTVLLPRVAETANCASDLKREEELERGSDLKPATT